MNLPNVSIILPTYNRVDSLKGCINSVVNQIYRNWELIIVMIHLQKMLKILVLLHF